MKQSRYLMVCLVVGGVLALAPRGVGGGDKTGKIGKVSEVAAPLAPTSDLAGTSWEGHESDGDYYSYTFLPGGQVRFTTNTSGSMRTYEDKGDYWAQNGPVVIIVMTNYVTRLGHLDGNRMSGDAWNFAGKRWTFKLHRK